MSRHTEYGNSPVGRLISGDPWVKQTTDANNREIRLKSNHTGSPWRLKRTPPA